MRYPLFLLTLALAACLLAGLGVWQLQRGQQKGELIATLEAGMAAPPLATNAQPLAYRRAKIEGRLGEERLYLYAFDKREGPGWKLIAPLAVEGGGWLLVDLGFVPDGKPPPATIDKQKIFSGILLPSQAPGLFDPAPNHQTGQWFSRDAVSMSRAFNLVPPARFFLQLEGQGDENLIRRPYQLNLPDNHFTYALTWFALSLIACSMLGIFLYRGRL